MDTFDDIRPYRDDEVGPTIARLSNDRGFIAFAGRFAAPGLPRRLRAFTYPALRVLIRRKATRLRSVADLQRLMSGYLKVLLQHTSDGMTVSGLDGLDPTASYLFISNHRDIALDPTFLNYALWLEGHPTTQVAIGDNLLGTGFHSHLMRVNKAFLVARDVSGAKAQLKAMRQTSAYMRNALEADESVWIAQREGRSKDGIDRTEPALLKMLQLAYRHDAPAVTDWLRRVRLVPVSITYEIDPCAPSKARELFFTAKDGRYEKRPGDDIESIETGVRGFKGRIHLHFSPPVDGDFADADQLARHLDVQIVSNLVAYPTHHYARARLNGSDSELTETTPRGRQAFFDDLHACPPEQVPYFLRQYANLVENQLAVRPP
ncbi:MAG: 1-acyl-sn-glycerol-3-phosphate acyltransferase [Gammaproteobacteria bacterium]|nr:1-acyl-sn-glycerol-3-phosphate acyltransferase [Gammaproteobacteria bacterium]MDE0442356.1 1-acyl-sn-glycerol-3-phosphate acyltransferase [Gammaproteobacteria bacterium]